MSLPVIPPPTEVVHGISLRGLTRAEAMEVQALAGQVEAQELLVLRLSTGESAAEVARWYGVTDGSVTAEVVKAAVRLSGLDPTPTESGSERSPSVKRTTWTTD